MHLHAAESGEVELEAPELERKYWGKCDKFHPLQRIAQSVASGAAVLRIPAELLGLPPSFQRGYEIGVTTHAHLKINEWSVSLADVPARQALDVILILSLEERAGLLAGIPCPL